MQPKFRFLSALPILLLCVSLACNFSMPEVTRPETAPTATAAPSPTPMALPPAIVETDPPAGSQIGVQQGVAFLFNQPMQRASVESALKLDGAPGIYTWIDDATLTFTPLQPLAADSTVTFTLEAGVAAANGLTLPDSQSLTFTTAPALAVTQTLPAADADDIRTDSAVVVAFNQPMVALGAESADLPAAFTLEPATPGRGEWLNTSTYIFYPDPALQGGAAYTVRLNTGLKSVAGLSLEEGLAWSFRTSFPRVVDVSPADSLPLGLEPSVTLTFNQPMDKASVEADLRFEGPGGPVPGSLSWNENATEAVFKPSGRLFRASVYVLRLSSASRSLNGQALQSGIQRNYVTYPEFGVAYTEPFNGGVKGYNDRMTIYLTAPVRQYFGDELLDLVKVSPPVSNLWISPSDTTLGLYGNFDADTLYTVTVSGDLQDQWGARLGNSFATTLRSSPPEPGLTLPFVSTLMVLPDDPRMAVQVTNLSQLDVSLGTLSLADFFRLQKDYQAFVNFEPADRRAWRVNTNTGTGTKSYNLSFSPEGALSPGLYLARLGSTELRQEYRHPPFFVLASRVNVVLKVAEDSVLVWVLDVQTGKPVAFKEVGLYDQTGGLRASGQTDANGLWRAQLEYPLKNDEVFLALVGAPGDEQFGMASTSFNIGIAPWEFDLPSRFYSQDDSKVYLYTDRPIYRPGDLVSFRGIARQVFDGRYSDLPVLNPWSASLQDLSNRPVESLNLSLSEFGGFDGQFRLPEGAAPGQWSIEVRGNATPDGHEMIYRVFFQVADYRKPEINLSVALSPQNGLQGQPLQATVRAEYFFGAPAGDLPFTWKLYREREYFSIPGFQSGAYAALWLGEWRSSYGVELASGTARTGADGSANLDLGVLEVDGTSRFTLQVTAIESGGFPLSARESAVLHPAAAYPGIRPVQWVGRAKEPLAFTLTSVDTSARPLAGKTLQTELQKVTWVVRPGDEGSFSPRYERKVMEIVDSAQVTTGADGLAEARLTPPDPGTYLLRVALDGNVSEALIWVGGQGQPIWPSSPYDQIRLTADSEKYQPGQTASVFIPNPFEQTARALVTTERGSLLSAQLVDVPAGGGSVALPLSDNEAPNVFVAVTLMGPSVQFRQGYLNLEVEPSSFVLNVELKASPEKAGPGEQVQLALRVTDSQGKPVRGEFSLAVVDLAALALADPNAPEIVPAFYDIQPLQVRTGLSNAIYALRLMPSAGGRGGGGGEMSVTIREKFPDTALWKVFTTDAEGRAQMSLTLPDSLTTWRVDARGLDRQTRVGQAHLNLVTSKDLLLRPITPRYLVSGDRTRISTYVNNNTSSDLEAEVNLKAGGAVLEDPQSATQKVRVPANGRALVSWWLRAGEADQADLVFSVKAGDLTDATRPADGAIPILRYAAPQAFVTAGVLPLAATQTEIVSLPRSFTPLGGDLTVELSPALGAYLLDAAKSLPEPDEFSSNETIASYLIANLAIVPALREAGLVSDDLARRERAIRDWANKLSTQQNSDGGWNWYRRGWGDAASDPILSAHVTYALGLVEQNNPSGLEYSIQRAKEYLASQMVFDYDTPGLDLDEQAFLMLAYYGTPTGQALGTLKSASPALGRGTDHPLDRLYEVRERLSPLGQACLGLAYLGINDPGLAGSLQSNLAATANRIASGAFWEHGKAAWRLPGSPVYTTSLVVYLLGQTDPASPLMTDAIRYLAASRSASRDWGGSMQTAWVLRALSSVLLGTGEFSANFSFAASLNGLEVARGQASGSSGLVTVTSVTPLTGLYAQSPNELKITRQDGNGKLYYRAILNVFRPAESAPALNRGIAVSRAYFDCSSEPCKPVTSWKLKPETVEKITVRVTVSLPQDMYYLNVQDFAPAGAEIVNPVLKTSEQGQETTRVEYFSPNDPYASGWGWWYFDSPRIGRDHVLWTADYLPAGTYVLTYTLIPSLPGEYRALPARAWMTFFPEVQGASAGTLFSIDE